MKEENYYKATVLDEDGNPVQPPAPTPAERAKGVAQIAAGGAIAAVGVPMLILPGPGAAAIAGGVALASKGHRNLTGREATAVEEKIDEVSEKLGSIAKEQAKNLGTKAVEHGPDLAREAVRKAPEVAKMAVEAAPGVAATVAEKAPIYAKTAAEQAPVIAKAVAENAPVYTAKAIEVAPGLAAKAIETAKIKGPEFLQRTKKSASIASGMGKETAKKAMSAFRDSRKK